MTLISTTLDMAEAADAAEMLCAISQFLFTEAQLLDRGAFAEWLELFHADGIYWLPSVRGQTDPLGVPSILYEDVGILTMRVDRLLEARALVLTPMPRTTHLVTNIVADMGDEDNIKAQAALLVVEQQDGRQRHFAGHTSYLLRRTDDTFRILLKRVELMDCDGVHAPITIPL